VVEASQQATENAGTSTKVQYREGYGEGMVEALRGNTMLRTKATMSDRHDRRHRHHRDRSRHHDRSRCKPSRYCKMVLLPALSVAFCEAPTTAHAECIRLPGRNVPFLSPPCQTAHCGRPEISAADGLLSVSTGAPSARRLRPANRRRRERMSDRPQRHRQEHSSPPSCSGCTTSTESTFATATGTASAAGSPTCRKTPGSSTQQSPRTLPPATHEPPATTSSKPAWSTNSSADCHPATTPH
jgi:hypothetical protein